MTTPEPTATAAQIAATIEKKQARRGVISAQLTGADTERATLRTEIGRAVADGQPTDALKKKLVQLNVDIESSEVGFLQLEVDIKNLKAELTAAEIAEASAAHALALAEWSTALDQTDAYLVDLILKEISPRLEALDGIRQRVFDAESVLRRTGARKLSDSELQRPQRTGGARGGRVHPLLLALRDFAAGKPFSVIWGSAPPIDHLAMQEHQASAPDWFKQATREAAGGGEQYSSEGMTLNELARL
jgi:hypothetical protein